MADSPGADFAYANEQFDDVWGLSYTLQAREGDALVTVRVMLHTREKIEQADVEQMCRVYVEEIFTLMCD